MHGIYFITSLSQNPDWFGDKLFAENRKSLIALHISPEVPLVLLFDSFAIYRTLS